MEASQKVLYVNSEIFPYLPESKISTLGRYLPQGIQESGKEIRSFMPRYGCVNERRNQLHEVIRLSGLNLVINNIDRPLVIKVSSISAARMQVYFIDNDDFFRRKQLAADTTGKFFTDNDERALFFARGVLETVKKLRWKPDIVHCQGWIASFIPFLIKKVYNQDPIFSDTKVVTSVYNEYLSEKFDDNIANKLSKSQLDEKDIAILTNPAGINLAQFAIRYSDGIVNGEENLEEELAKAVKDSKLPVLECNPSDATNFSYISDFNNFYDKILASND